MNISAAGVKMRLESMQPQQIGGTHAAVSVGEKKHLVWFLLLTVESVSKVRLVNEEILKNRKEETMHKYID